MLDSNDEELTKKNKAQMISSKQKEYFKGVYEEWLKAYDAHFDPKQDVDEELINTFPFNEDSNSTEE